MPSAARETETREVRDTTLGLEGIGPKPRDGTEGNCGPDQLIDEKTNNKQTRRHQEWCVDPNECVEITHMLSLSRAE